jgi:glyoxylase-like metal-dependent hydrolase (beta-lactamase superfamily II)
MPTYSIKAIKCCEQSTPGPEMYLFSHWDEWIEVYFYFFILQGDDGSLVLVDTGVRDVDEVNPGVIAGVGERGAFRMDKEKESVPSLLAREGIDAELVDTVILTHLHYDHCSNVKLFPRAKIVVNREGWLKFQGCRFPELIPHPVFPRDVVGYLAGEGRDRLVLAEDGAEVVPGISCFYTGGHTLCSQAVKVATCAGSAILTGDVAFLYGNLERNHPVGLVTDVVECYAALERIRREADLVVPAHDPGILERHPGGVIVP